MVDMITRLRAIIDELQAEIEQEIEEKRKNFRYRLERRIVVFEQDAIEQHRKMRLKFLSFLRNSRVIVILTAPLIYLQIIPIFFMDVFATLYQQTCFRVYGIPRVKRSEFVIMDRKYLVYLNLIEKVNCMYCEYANGVVSYVQEIASRTEQYWCPIKHARKMKHPHDRYFEFLEYGDAEGFRNSLEKQRESCRACEDFRSCDK
jgi:hypothetical protein